MYLKNHGCGINICNHHMAIIEFSENQNEVAMIMHHRGIAITEGVAQQICSVYKTRRLTDITLKWMETPLEVREIIRE